MASVRIMTNDGKLVAMLALHAIPTKDPVDCVCSPPDILCYDEIKAITLGIAMRDAEGLDCPLSLGAAGRLVALSSISEILFQPLPARKPPASFTVLP